MRQTPIRTVTAVKAAVVAAAFGGLVAGCAPVQMGAAATVGNDSISPPNLLDELGNYQAVEIAYAERANGGKLPTATASVNAITKQFNTAECHVYKTDAVKVSPQFGQFNFTQSSVVAAPDTLSAAGGAAPRTSTSGTTPSC